MSCNICFCPIEGGPVRCTDLRCNALICSECAIRFIDFIHEDGTGQKISCCGREGCEGEYDQVSFGSLPFSTTKKYREALMAYFTKAKKNEIDEREKQRIFIERMKQERMKFYTDNMPRAVMKVAQIAFADKLRKVKKAEAKQQAQQYNRVCINLFCGGFLDKDMTCCKCQISFCSLCEEEKKDSHVCRDEMKQSVSFLNSLQTCPHCGTRIEKGEGCMAITCAVCNTNFWYSTGEKGDAGNHGKSIPVVVSAFRQLSVEYHASLPGFLYLKLNELESRFLEPVTSEESLIGAASRARETQRLSDFSSLYSKTIRQKMEKMILGKKLTQIEKMLAEKPDGYLNILSDVLLPSALDRKVVMYKGVEKDDTLYVEQFGVANNVKQVAEQLNLQLFEVVNALESNSGRLGLYYFEYV